MNKYYALPIATEYWKPGENYLKAILSALEKRVADGDFVVLSEKALSTALGNVIDESGTHPSFNARIISQFWMRIGWGYFLGILSRLGPRLRQRLREYPVEVGSRHKQVALQWAGPLQALMWGSEGGIDGSNLPFSYVSLPLSNTYSTAKFIHSQIWHKIGKKVCVIIIDTDRTYAFRNFYFTPRPKPMRGIHSIGGFASYIIGRLLKLRKRPTPLAIAGGILQTKEALRIANIADKARGPGSGATVWDMARRFTASTTGISWDMLSKVKHKPIVIIRKEKPDSSEKET
jgi:F420-0:gamma-glutamyl ligase-like protein